MGSNRLMLLWSKVEVGCHRVENGRLRRMGGLHINQNTAGRNKP